MFTIFLRKLCCGSKKWRWLHQWMISTLRVLSMELLGQTLRCSTREFSTEQNHPEYSLHEIGQSGGDESSQRRPFPSRKTDRLPDLRALPGHWSQEGDNCSFRHDMNKRAKSTQPNPSPRSSTQQSVKNAWRTRSPRGRSPSWKMARLPCEDYLKGTCTTPFCE